MLPRLLPLRRFARSRYASPFGEDIEQKKRNYQSLMDSAEGREHTPMEQKLQNYREDFEGLYRPRVRLAPSPTGQPHLGTLRTALFNFLFARRHQGTLIMRLEDTDAARTVPGAEQQIVEQLRWAGIHWDEGFATAHQPHGPYRQSERTPLYQKYARFLLDNGDAYRCFCSQEELRARRAQSGNDALLYDRRCLYLTEREVAARLERGLPHVLRLLVPKESALQRDVSVAEDLVQGRVEFPHSAVDDQVLLKADGRATYHLANVVDDHLMGVTHVIRGKEWLPSLPKHLLLYAKLGFAPPRFAHLPLLLSARGGKMSKREQEVGIHNFQTMGYEPEALLNSVALLGWRSRQHEKNPTSLDSQEAFYKAQFLRTPDLIEQFALERVNKSDVKMDPSRFIFLNGEHLRRQYYFFNEQEKAQVLVQFRADMAEHIPDLRTEILRTPLPRMLQIFAIVLPRINFKWQMRHFRYFFGEPEDFFQLEMPDKPAKTWAKKLKKNPQFYKQLLGEVRAEVKQAARDFTKDQLNRTVSGFLFDRAGTVKNEDVYSPLRIAMTGHASGPSVGEIAELLGPKVFYERVD